MPCSAQRCQCLPPFPPVPGGGYRAGGRRPGAPGPGARAAAEPPRCGPGDGGPPGRRERLRALALGRGALGLETLLDLLLGLAGGLRHRLQHRDPPRDTGDTAGNGGDSGGDSDSDSDRHVRDFLSWAEPAAAQVQELQLQRGDFEILKVIGRGAFSEVSCFREERDVLARGDRRWITRLHFAFQDPQCLYLVMEYYIGGDLLTLLSKFGDRLPLAMARFYLAELVMANDSVHRLGYVHRDIKPDNILLDRWGHIRLGDFGSCLRLGPDGTVRSAVAVGTPDYLSPEMLLAVEDPSRSYGPECDWWALGVLAYEMFYGRPPFFADTVLETYAKILHFQDHLHLPDTDDDDDGGDGDDTAAPGVPAAMRGSWAALGAAPGPRGAHWALFAGTRWRALRRCPAPFAPSAAGATDTSNFDVLDDCLSQPELLGEPGDPPELGLHLPFVGYSYARAEHEDEEEEEEEDEDEEWDQDTAMELEGDQTRFPQVAVAAPVAVPAAVPVSVPVSVSAVPVAVPAAPAVPVSVPVPEPVPVSVPELREALAKERRGREELERELGKLRAAGQGLARVTITTGEVTPVPPVGTVTPRPSGTEGGPQGGSPRCPQVSPPSRRLQEAESRNLELEAKLRRLQSDPPGPGPPAPQGHHPLPKFGAGGKKPPEI
ncbi:myotonin-protein kinase [Camarhynchus parvulus]|uniref:myotonin-protein kinase n=1 Tax=Geospiza parvula TaxID=87175 RepID=UPI001237F63A|nr:myotonin-protein kinase [Camarhynchus parvulus]